MDAKTKASVSNGELTAMRKAGVELAKRLAEIGLDVYLYESHQDADGRWVDENGNEAENGYYVGNRGEIHIDLNAGENGDGIMVYTLAHEVTHFIRDYNPREFKILADFVIEHYGKKGVSVSRQIREIMQSENVDWDTAYEELVAKSCESFFTDSNIAERIIELRQKDKRTWETLRNKVLDFLKWMKSVLSGHDPESEQGAMFHRWKDEIDRIYDAFYSALSGAIETYQTVGPMTAEETNHIETKNHDISRKPAARSYVGDTATAERTASGAKHSFRNSKNGMANDSLLRYDAELTQIIEDKGGYIVDSFEKLKSVVNLAFDKTDVKATAYFGIIDAETLGKIKNSIPNLPAEYAEDGKLFKAGRTYSIATTLDSIRHLVDEKGLTREDVIDYLDRLADTILEFDTVYFDYYTDSRRKRLPGLEFKKVFVDGTLISFNIVSRKKTSISMQTLFMEKADYKKRKSAKTPLMQNAPAHTPKVRVGQTSEDMVAHSEPKVKDKKSSRRDNGHDGHNSVAASDAVYDRLESEAINGDAIKNSKRAKASSDGYGAFREALAKQGLDKLSQKLGSHFPLSASFDATMRGDQTPLAMETVKAEGAVRGKKDSAFTIGKNIFRSTYGIKTSVHINQLNIDANLYTDIAKESISKAISKKDEQVLLDVIPHYKEILANSVFMAIERIAHTSGKGAALYGYRLYNLYWYDENGKKTPHCLVSTVVQSTDNAEGYVFRDIENVTIEQGLPGNKAGMSPPLNSDTYTIAQLYKFVKRLNRDDGGLKYSPQEQAKYGFSYRKRDDGVLFSRRNSKQQKAPTFYSYMGVVVDGVKQDKLGAASVVNMLKGKGVKDEEIKWSGIETWLEGKKSVTKAELQEFIAGSQLQIDEKLAVGGASVTLERSAYGDDSWDVMRGGEILDTYSWSEDSGLYESDMTGGGFSTKGRILEHFKEKYGSGNTRWEKYKLDGGTNYREIVFTMPNSTYTNQAMKAHWGADAKGILAHARIQDFVDTTGNKMLFVEEIQSDWHNEGHKEGYESKSVAEDREKVIALGETIDVISEQIDALSNEKGTLDIAYFKGEKLSFDEYFAKANVLIAKIEKLSAKVNRLINERESLFLKTKKVAPDAPFRTTYQEFVLKRLIRMAAEEGYNSIGWTPAQIQSDRWSDEFAEGYRIEYDQDIPKFLRKYGKKWDATVGKTDIQTKQLSAEEERDLPLVMDLIENGEAFIRQYRGIEEVWSMEITDSMKDSVLYEGQVMYQRRGNSTSNRSVLANALEGFAQNEDESRRLAEYKAKIDLINAEERKLQETRARIAELSFAKGPKDVAKIKSLQETATRIANRINTYDKQLLRLEATAPLMAVLEREKAALRKRDKQKMAEAVAKQREEDAKILREVVERNTKSRERNVDNRKKTVLRNKIKRVVSELDGLLNRGTKERNVKTDMQETVGSALRLASVIFNDNISNEDIVLMGSTIATEEEQKLLDRYAEFIKKRDSSPY